MPSRHRTARSYRSILGLTGTTVLIVLGGLLFAAILPWLSGRDIAVPVFRARESERTPDPEVIENIRLPSNPIEGIQRFFVGFVHLDFGVSWVNPSNSAWQSVLAGFGPSVFLAGTATLLGTMIACALIWPRVNAYSQGRRSHAGLLSSAVLSSVPEFVLASLLISFIAIQLGYLPATG